MHANHLFKLAMLGFALASLGQTAAQASPPKKTLGQPAQHIVVKDPPAATKAPNPAAAPTRHAITPAGNNAFTAGGGLADLVPAAYFGTPGQVGLPAGFPGVQYCDPNPQGGVPIKLRFRVRNQGGTSASPFNIRFNFAGAGALFVPVDGLSPGDEKSGAVDIPAGCFPPGYSTICQFIITVDSSAQIPEGNEANNSANSFCVGPAT